MSGLEIFIYPNADKSDPLVQQIKVILRAGHIKAEATARSDDGQSLSALAQALEQIVRFAVANADEIKRVAL